MFRTITLAAVVLLIPAAICLAEADKDVESLINKGLASYKAGRTNEAIAFLQEVVLLLQRSQEKGLARFFPKAPEGWEAGKLESSSAAIGTGEGGATYTQLTQRFTRKQDGATATVTLSNSNQLIESQRAMAESYKNPEVLRMMNQDPDTKIKLIDQDEWVGWTVIQKDRDAQATALCTGCLLSIQIDKPDEAAVDAFLKATDLKGIAGAAGVSQPTSKPAKE